MAAYDHPNPSPMLPRLLAALGAVFAAAAVGLSAYAAHAVAGDVRSQLQTAALFAFGHGIALAALAPRGTGRLRVAALLLLALGTMLFSGSLVVRHAFGASTALAPAGGMLMILAWLMLAADGLRR